jgi:hypothetical protein
MFFSFLEGQLHFAIVASRAAAPKKSGPAEWSYIASRSDPIDPTNPPDPYNHRTLMPARAAVLPAPWPVGQALYISNTDD